MDVHTRNIFRNIKKHNENIDTIIVLAVNEIVQGFSDARRLWNLWNFEVYVMLKSKELIELFENFLGSLYSYPRWFRHFENEVTQVLTGLDATSCAAVCVTLSNFFFF